MSALMGAARIQSSMTVRIKLRNTPPSVASNNLLGPHFRLLLVRSICQLQRSRVYVIRLSCELPLQWESGRTRRTLLQAVRESKAKRQTTSAFFRGSCPWIFCIRQTYFILLCQSFPTLDNLRNLFLTPTAEMTIERQTILRSIELPALLVGATPWASSAFEAWSWR